MKAVQLREKDSDQPGSLRTAYELRKLTARYGARLFINDRIDIALAVDADGVHLGASSIPVHRARKILGDKRLIGVSCHNRISAITAQEKGADFITFGPVFYTPSKAAYGDPVGVDKLAEIVELLRIPVFALGGINRKNVSQVIAAGAHGIALISAILAADDPYAETKSLLSIPPDSRRLNMPESFIHNDLRFNSYGSYLRRRFGCRVSKVNVDGGFTCPNRDGAKGTGGCIYCNNSLLLPPGTQPQIPIEEQMAAGMAYHRQRLGSEKFIIYFQKFTNTYAPADRLRDLFSRALDHPDVVGISVGTRPDALEDDALDLLGELAETRYVCVELGLQSMDDVRLKAINRGHTLADYLRTVDRISGRGIELCTHLIYGFPGETREEFLRSADLIASLPVDSVKLHQLHAVTGTRLAEMYYAGEFIPLSHAEYVAAVCDFLERIPPDVAIQRLYGSAPRRHPGGADMGPEKQPDVVHRGQRAETARHLAGMPARRPAGGNCPVMFSSEF